MTEEMAVKLRTFVETEIVEFHMKRLLSLRKTKLPDLLRRKNPYLFKAKNVLSASDLIAALLEAKLSSSEEATFGHFMEALAIFVVGECFGGEKTQGGGIDLTFTRNGIRYLVAVKSGKNWANSSSMETQLKKFKTAVATLKQNRHVGEVQPVLGICYANFPRKHYGDYLHLGGQDFWELISGDQHFYREIIEPIGYRAREFNDDFHEKQAAITNSLTVEFIENFCYPAGETKGQIDWVSLVDFVSRNRSEEPTQNS
jgi:hypothetical protein